MYRVRLRGPANITPLVDAPIENIPNARRFMRKETELALLFARDRVKEYYNARHRLMEYQEGDLVYINLYRGYALPGYPPRKIS